MTQWADPEDVAAHAQSWTAGQLDCRVTGNHAWDRKRTFLVRSSPGVLTIRQRCSRGCRVEREATMNDHGYLTSPWKPDYSGAPNYLLRSDDGKPVGRIDRDGKAQLRRRWISGIPITEIEEP